MKTSSYAFDSKGCLNSLFERAARIPIIIAIAITTIAILKCVKMEVPLVVQNGNVRKSYLCCPYKIQKWTMIIFHMIGLLCMKVFLVSFAIYVAYV